MLTSTIRVHTVLHDQKNPPLINPALTKAKQLVDSKTLFLKELENEFVKLTKISNDKKHWDSLTEQRRIEIEKSKLIIMQMVQASIDQQYGTNELSKKILNAEKPKNSLWRKLMFGFLIVADVTLMTIGSYFGAVSLMQLLVPQLAEIAITVVAGTATAIEGMMMYSVLKPWLQQGLGMVPTAEPENLAKSYNNRLDLMEKMNGQMVNNLHYTLKQGPDIYNSYRGILQTFNQDMKKTSLQPYEEPRLKKVGRYILSGLNFCLSIAGTYFGTVMLLTAVSAVLLGTPVGWGIIAVFIAAQLITRLLIRKSSVFSLLNPFATQHDSTRKKLIDFQDKTRGIDHDLEAMKKLKKLNQLENGEDKQATKGAENQEKLSSLRLKEEKERLIAPTTDYATKTAECPAFFKPCLSLEMQMTDKAEQENRAKIPTTAECPF